MAEYELREIELAPGWTHTFIAERIVSSHTIKRYEKNFLILIVEVKT